LIGHILRRNCLLKHVIEGKLEGRVDMTGRRGRRRKQLLDELGEKRRYWKLKEEALDRTLWRTRFGRGYGPVVRQTAEWNVVSALDLSDLQNVSPFYCNPLSPISTSYSQHWETLHFSNGRFEIARQHPRLYSDRPFPHESSYPSALYCELQPD
jgi:hypothetical protein